MELEFDYGTCATYATGDGCRAEVRLPDGKVIKRFKGETAHSDADRYAGDFHSAARNATKAW